MTEWKGKSRGGVAGYRIFVFFIRYLGLSFTYFFSKFVALYFMVIAGSARRNISIYFRRVTACSAFVAFFRTFWNYSTFGKILVDKISVLSGAVKGFTYNFDGEQHLRHMADGETGGVLINAHVGNWEIAGQLLERLQTRINILMFDAEHENVKEYLEDVLVNKNVSIIAIKEDNSHMELIRRALANKEIVAMNGDRHLKGARVIECDFFGKKANFPVGPFYVAGKFGAPITFAYAMKEKRKHYHFYATPLRHIEGFDNPKTRDAAIAAMVQDYVRELERIVKLYPYQWFNYFNFWEDGK